VDGYPFACPIQVRWRDVDALGHVNNAVIVTYLETARAELWRERFGGGTAIPFMVARLEINYRRQISLDDRVWVGVRVSGLRGARYCFEYRVEASGELAAEAVTVMAHVRPGERRPSRIPDDLRRTLLRMTEPRRIEAVTEGAAHDYGLDLDFRERVRPLFRFLFENYWRVDVSGMDNIPESGPVLLVGNHSGGLPFDATMICYALSGDGGPGGPTEQDPGIVDEVVRRVSERLRTG